MPFLKAGESFSILSSHAGNASKNWSGGGFSSTVYKDIDIYYASSVSSNGYTSHADDAVNEYNALSTSIDFDKVSTNSESEVAVWGGNYGLDYLGVMEPFKYDDMDRRVDASIYERWDKAYIKLNDECMDYYKLSSNQRRHTTLHEFGHMFALQHQGQDVNSVMKQGAHFYTDLTTLDKYNIQWKFN